MMSRDIIFYYSVFNVLILTIGTESTPSLGFEYYRDLDIYYKVYKDRKTWHEARLACLRDDATLAMPKNQAEATALSKIFDDNQKYLNDFDTRYIYIGFHDLFKEGRYVTERGFSLKYFHHAWLPSQPDNANGNENCGTLSRNGLLNDAPCDNSRVFICQREDVPYEERLSRHACYASDPGYVLEPYSEKYFKLHMELMNWNDARSICHAEGGNLAVIESRQEEDFLVKLFNNTDNLVHYSVRKDLIYIGFHGLFKKQHFVTLKGGELEKLPYMRWSNGEPNDYGNNENCGTVHELGGLNDMACETLLQFVCERKYSKMFC